MQLIQLHDAKDAPPSPAQHQQRRQRKKRAFFSPRAWQRAKICRARKLCAQSALNAAGSELGL